MESFIPRVFIVIDEGGTSNCSSESDPTITLYSPTLVANIGATVILPCRASGKPTPQVTWMDNYNVPLSLSTNLRHRVLDSGDLLIEELLWEDMGGYTCQAKSGNRQQVVSTFLYPLRVSIPNIHLCSNILLLLNVISYILK